MPDDGQTHAQLNFGLQAQITHLADGRRKVHKLEVNGLDIEFKPPIVIAKGWKLVIRFEPE